MSRFTLFLDVSGRPSRNPDPGRPLVAAGVAFTTDELPTLRALYAAPSRKWKNSTREDAQGVIAFVQRWATAITVFRVERVSPLWEDYWRASDVYHDKMAYIAKRRVGFVKGGTILKYWLFGETSARLMGDAVRLTGRPRVLSEHGLGVVESVVICDSDIEGKENIEVFKSLFERAGEKPQPILAAHGLHHYVRATELRTEEEEPLLLLPDYIAGIFAHCPDEMDDLRRELEADPKTTVVDFPFDIAYEEIFGQTGVGQILWPRAGKSKRITERA